VKVISKENWEVNNIPDVLELLDRELDIPTWSEIWTLLITQSQIPKPQDNIMETKTSLDERK
jgi:hypothetical protein